MRSAQSGSFVFREKKKSINIKTRPSFTSCMFNIILACSGRGKIITEIKLDAKLGELYAPPTSSPKTQTNNLFTTF